MDGHFGGQVGCFRGDFDICSCPAQNGQNIPENRRKRTQGKRITLGPFFIFIDHMACAAPQDFVFSILLSFRPFVF